MVERAQGMHRDGRTAAEIAAVLGISRATVYRHLADQ
jgi:DNA-binding CsgD family transcriptional regulator